MVRTSENVKKFHEVPYGELHIGINEKGQPMFCINDVCRGLELYKREADRIVSDKRYEKREYLVRPLKNVMCRVFVDENAFLSLVTESRKNQADAYRRWAMDCAHTLMRERGVEVTTPATTIPECIADEGPYPTLEEYFRDYVPVDYFIPLLSATLKDYVDSMRGKTTQQRKEVEHRVSVLNTFNMTLIGNMSALQRK